MTLCLLRHGARPLDYVRFQFYKKSAIERSRYLTIYKYFRLLKKIGYREKSVYGKIAQYNTFSNYIHRDWMIADAKTPKEKIIGFIISHQVVFAKPNHGDQGHGILKISSNDSLTIDELLKMCKKQAYVVEASIKNESCIRQLNPSSLNTVRAFTLIMKNGSTKILSVMLRVGKAGSYVDNWGSGGVAYNIDLETGICVDYGRDKMNQPYIYHPGSNVKMIGFKLPDFEKLKDLIIELSQKVPKARFVGWDIAIAPDGYELVEMNCPGGHDILQAHGKPFGDILKKELSK